MGKSCELTNTLLQPFTLSRLPGGLFLGQDFVLFVEGMCLGCQDEGGVTFAVDTPP